MEWTFEEGHIYHTDGQGNVTAELTYARSGVIANKNSPKISEKIPHPI